MKCAVKEPDFFITKVPKGVSLEVKKVPTEVPPVSTEVLEGTG